MPKQVKMNVHLENHMNYNVIRKIFKFIHIYINIADLNTRLMNKFGIDFKNLSKIKFLN